MTSSGIDPVLVYLHGFNSSPQSQKAAQLRALLPELAPEVELVVPELGFDPDRALQRATQAVTSAGNRPVGVLGSSMGGFYASVLSARLGVRAALVNPAAWPGRLLEDYLGPQHNPYTGEDYELTREHIAALEAMDPAGLALPKNLFLLVQTADETLDYREILAKHPGAMTWLQPGGDHRFQEFERVVPAILAFLFGGSFR
ncbi:MAG: YqiA/YcfP family alpha/beta fold hydrolase [Marinobacter sp.]